MNKREREKEGMCMQARGRTSGSRSYRHRKGRVVLQQARFKRKNMKIVINPTITHSHFIVWCDLETNFFSFLKVLLTLF